MLSDYDIVGLQEVDDGSLRTGFLNQTQYLAERAGFPFWSHQSNRKVSKLARTCNSLLSRLRPSEVHDHKLPGRIPGRGALAAYYGDDPGSLMVVVVHLALGKRSRRRQLAFVKELIHQRPHVIVMGDMNTPVVQIDMQQFLLDTGLHAPLFPESFPSWRPQRAIDHILVSSSLSVERCEVLDLVLSDHRPVSLDVMLPPGCAAGLKPKPDDEIAAQQQQE
jgi:endonuclease/exonuclease/phosphatase family metal-dependent hydrolase